jgi:tRNA(Arg) A34 adenosine deaminase TadA
MDQRIVTKLYNTVSREPSIYNGRTIAAFSNNNFFPVWGINSTKTHPTQAKNAKHPEAIYLHAEVAAYIKAKRLFSTRDFAKSDAYIMRVFRDPLTCEIRVGLARPCSGCFGLIKKLGVRRMYYSNDAGSMTCEHVQ